VKLFAAAAMKLRRGQNVRTENIHIDVDVFSTYKKIRQNGELFSTYNRTHHLQGGGWTYQQADSDRLYTV